MSVYFVANIRITDENEYRKYLAGTDEVFAKFNGEYMAVDQSPLVLEGNWDYSRAVLIKFPDMASLQAWYNSQEYQQILCHRLQGAHCDTIVVQGG